jgi:hypothetical protein
VPSGSKLAAAGALVGVVVAVAVAVVATSAGPSRGASRASPSQGVATVQRRDLIATDTEPGTISYADPRTVWGRLAGTITWLPAIGQVIKPGQTLYEVNGAPVVLLDGATPAYRTLSAADTPGPDILELNRDLVGMGFDPSHQIQVSDTWQAATTEAVDRWQGSLGETETGTIALGQVVFLPGPRRVTALDTTVGATGGGGSGAASATAASGAASATAASGTASATAASGGASAGTAVSGAQTAGATGQAPRPELVSLRSTVPTATASAPITATAGSAPRPSPRRAARPSGRAPGRSVTSSGSGGPSPSELKALTALLQAELRELASARASSSAAAARAPASGSGSRSTASSSGSGGSTTGASSSTGGGGSSSQAIMQTSSTQLVVTVDLDAAKQSEAVVGEPVTVELPNDATVDGRIAAVSPVAQSSSSSGAAGATGGTGSNGSASSGATIPVTITLAHELQGTGLDQAAVSVNFEQQQATNVLSVPVTALLATQGGGYAVQQAQPPHRLIPVTPGLFAAGYVQISGPGIYPGLTVTDSQG